MLNEAMILRRLGNKKKIASDIMQHFPEHKVYVEPFFGAGGMFFNKPRAKYNIVNDIDSDVFNLFQVILNQREAFEKAFHIMPIHSDLLDHWKVNQETDPIKKALRFIFLSNLTYLGKQDTMRSDPNNSKKIITETLQPTFDLLCDVQMFNKDFRVFLKSLSLDSRKRKKSKETLIYVDSPYMDTINTYSDNGKWTEGDSKDLFDALKQTKCKWAMSEFNHPFIVKEAKKRNLNIITIGERQNIKNKRIEILITNYQSNQLSAF